MSLLVALVLGFDWGKYLQEHGFKAAPVSCFKHVSPSLLCVEHVVCTGLPRAPLTGGERPGRGVWSCKEGSWGFLTAKKGRPVGGPWVLGEEAEADLVRTLPVVIGTGWGQD